MTKRVVAALLLLCTFAVALPARADFDSIAKALDGKRGVKRIWIPFLGVARLAVWVVSPKGVYDFELATFEGANNLDPRELKTLLHNEAGKGFTPLVQVYSLKKKEWSFIYAKPSKNGKRMELMILAHDGGDTTLVRVDLDAEMVARELDSPREVRKVAQR